MSANNESSSLETTTPEYWNSQARRIRELLTGKHYLHANVRVPVKNNRYMVGFDSLDDYIAGECSIELQELDDGYIFSLGNTIIDGKRSKVSLPYFRGRANRTDTRTFDLFVITGTSEGFGMVGVTDGMDIPITPTATFDPAVDMFATCIFALENHQRHQTVAA